MIATIEKSVTLHAPIKQVWHAIADSSEFGRWFMVKIDAPFSPGSISRGHITYPGYEHIPWEARIVRMDEPHLFSFTWHPYAINPVVNYAHETPTLVEFRLKTIVDGTQTHLTIVESGFDAVPEHRRNEAWRMNENGWGKQLENIRAYVEA